MSKPIEFEMLVDALKSLPGVGTKNAKKWAFFLLAQDEKYINDFTKRILSAKQKIINCNECGNFSNKKLCSICENDRRDFSKLLIVTTPEDVDRIESSNTYNGLYHITRGEVSIRKNVMIEHINLSTIRQRVLNNSFKEIIIATSYTHDGEMTADYIVRMLEGIENIQIYRIGFGIPLNSSIDYADDETLKQSLLNKRILVKK